MDKRDQYKDETGVDINSIENKIRGSFEIDIDSIDEIFKYIWWLEKQNHDMNELIDGFIQVLENRISGCCHYPHEMYLIQKAKKIMIENKKGKRKCLKQKK